MTLSDSAEATGILTVLKQKQTAKQIISTPSPAPDIPGSPTLIMLEVDSPIISPPPFRLRLIGTPEGHTPALHSQTLYRGH